MDGRHLNGVGLHFAQEASLVLVAGTFVWKFKPFANHLESKVAKRKSLMPGLTLELLQVVLNVVTQLAPQVVPHVQLQHGNLKSQNRKTQPI